MLHVIVDYSYWSGSVNCWLAIPFLFFPQLVEYIYLYQLKYLALLLNNGVAMCLVWRCQLGLATTYLIDLCRPVSGSRSSRSLRSSERGLLSVPFARTTIMQSRACSVVAPTVWNSLPPALRLLPRTLSDTFYNQLKTV